jgi:hypothetical protein
LLEKEARRRSLSILNHHRNLLLNSGERGKKGLFVYTILIGQFLAV